MWIFRLHGEHNMPFILASKNFITFPWPWRKCLRIYILCPSLYIFQWRGSLFADQG